MLQFYSRLYRSKGVSEHSKKKKVLNKKFKKLSRFFFHFLRIFCNVSKKIIIKIGAGLNFSAKISCPRNLKWKFCQMNFFYQNQKINFSHVSKHCAFFGTKKVVMSTMKGGGGICMTLTRIDWKFVCFDICLLFLICLLTYYIKYCAHKISMI